MRRKKRVKPRFTLFMLFLFGVAVIGIVLAVRCKPTKKQEVTVTPEPIGIEVTPTPVPTAKPELPDGLSVSPADSSLPSVLGFSSTIQHNRAETSHYERSEKVYFPTDAKYTKVPGVLTFAGNNYRNSFSYGITSVTERKMYRIWEQKIGQIDSWTGTGWTGQPLIVQWPDKVREVLGVSDTYKTNTSFVEVIYPAMDGKIYFFDLETGAQTRDPINTGSVMKSTACLDPNGFPLLYVGDSIAGKTDSGLYTAYVHVYSLISNEEIYRFGKHDYFSYREWQAYDGSPLIIDDTLFYAGENGVLYSCKLNTAFNAEEGTVTVNPESLVKYRYTGKGYNKGDAAGKRWYGVESSIAGFRDWLFFADNGGRLQCVNANTYELEYVTDIGENADATVVVEEDYDADTIYLYTAGQAYTADASLGDKIGYSWHKKINGLTGEIVWENKCPASTGDENANGGTIATPHIGHGNIDDLVIYAMDLAVLQGDDDIDTEDTEPEEDIETGALGGRLIAYSKASGDVVWSVEQEGAGDYWASPVVVYDSEQRAYLIQCDRAGFVKLYDASNGSVLYSLDLGSRIDSTPAVFNNYLVVGTRGKGGSGETPKIICVKIA